MEKPQIMTKWWQSTLPGELFNTKIKEQRTTRAKVEEEVQQLLLPLLQKLMLNQQQLHLPDLPQPQLLDLLQLLDLPHPHLLDLQHHHRAVGRLQVLEQLLVDEVHEDH
jgi:hypothetical protein